MKKPQRFCPDGLPHEWWLLHRRPWDGLPFNPLLVTCMRCKQRWTGWLGRQAKRMWEKTSGKIHHNVLLASASGCDLATAARINGIDLPDTYSQLDTFDDWVAQHASAS